MHGSPPSTLKNEIQVLSTNKKDKDFNHVADYNFIQMVQAMAFKNSISSGIEDESKSNNSMIP